MKKNCWKSESFHQVDGMETTNSLKDRNIVKERYTIYLCGVAFSVFAGMTVFTVLGNMAHQKVVFRWTEIIDRKKEGMLMNFSCRTLFESFATKSCLSVMSVAKKDKKARDFIPINAFFINKRVNASRIDLEWSFFLWISYVCVSIWNFWILCDLFACSRKMMSMTLHGHISTQQVRKEIPNLLGNTIEKLDIKI